MSASAAIADSWLRRAFGGQLAAHPLDVLLGTDTLLLGVCPRLSNGTGTAADGRASPRPPSARLALDCAILRRTVMNNAGWLFRSILINFMAFAMRRV